MNRFGIRVPIWDRSQRAVVAAPVVVLSIIFAVMCLLRPDGLSDPQPIDGARATELPGRLDPNVASAGDLSAIPDLGQKRAKAIVAYREDFVKHHAGQRAFRSTQDLTNVEGIGLATAANIEPFVMFPAGVRGK